MTPLGRSDTTAPRSPRPTQVNSGQSTSVWPADGDRLMTLEQVCDFLQITTGTARKQRVEGKFVPAYRVGKHLRFRCSAVLRWLDEHADEI